MKLNWRHVFLGNLPPDPLGHAVAPRRQLGCEHEQAGRLPGGGPGLPACVARGRRGRRTYFNQGNVLYAFGDMDGGA
jgi:hypothetical protein